MDISIIIVTFNTKSLTLDLLARLHSNPSSVSHEIIVVDNASPDQTSTAVQTVYPDVLLIQNSDNLGFAKACNAGAKIAKGRHLIFLNSDTEPVHGALDQLIEYMDTHPNIGIIGPNLISLDGKHIQMAWGWDPILFGEAKMKALSPRMIRRFPVLTRIVDFLQRRARQVPYVCGACLIMRREAFMQISGFDAEFELYFEDADLCRRARLNGWKVEFIPEAKIIHHLGGTAGRESSVPLVYRQSQLHYYHRHASRAAFLLLKSYLYFKWLILRISDNYSASFIQNFKQVISGSRLFSLSDMEKAPDILVFKLSAIGDIILTTPILPALKEKYPGTRITFMAGREAAPLLENHPDISEIWTVDQMIFWNKKIFSLFRLLREIRRRSFDQVYILHWSPVFHFFFWLSGIPERYGFAREGKSFRLTRGVPYTEADASRHDVNQYLSVIGEEFAPAGSVTRTPRLYFNENERAEVCRLFESLPSDAVFIAIAPGGGNNPKLHMPQKRWPAENIAELIKLLLKDKNRFILIIGDKSERDLLDRWLAPNEHINNLAGRFNLRQTALVIEHSHLFIGNDSGLLHMAGALGIPSLSFFGPTSPSGKIPEWTRMQTLYTGEPCSPCYRFGHAPACPYNLKCLNNISVQTAMKAVSELL